MRLLRRAAELSAADWRYLAVAVAELLIARLRLMNMDAGDIVRAHRHSARTGGAADRPEPRTLSIQRMSWALGAAGAHVPWRGDCLVQAMAGHRWLRRHGIEADFVIGVDKTKNGSLASHAWLSFNGAVVTGGPVDRFTPLVDPRRE